MSNFWIITDTHFGHKGIVEAGHRPEKFELKILSGLMYLEPEDIVIHLGDVAFSFPNIWTDRLRRHVPGKLWLTRGNHDKSTGWYLERGFDFVGEAISLKWQGQKILFSHEPQAELGDHDVNIHGHIHLGVHHAHENLPNSLRHIGVHMENHWHPWSLKEILKRGSGNG